MIAEDYVSFETAKLLKEKGFDEECIGYFVDGEPDIKRALLGETNSTWEQECYSAPTLQMTMKWLRKVHGFHIILRISRNTFFYGFKVVDNKGNVPCINNFVFDSYEEACEAAIKYCLENLI